MEIKNNYGLFIRQKDLINFVMRTLIFLFCTAAFSLSSGDLLSQDVKIKIDEDKSITVDEVFEIIKAQTNYRFIYRSDAFIDAPKINLKKGLINAHDLLIKSLSFGNLYYELAPDRTIILKDKNHAIIQQSISGIVTDKNGSPLTGVTVRIQGTRKGALTDFDGNYSINAKTGDVLLFTYIGKETVLITVGDSSTINVSMPDGNEALEEVVVTALGIEKEKKAIGYAVSSLKSESVEGRTEGDFARVIAGKVAGLNITGASGLSGSGTNIVIRGLSSFNGNNQALIVVDGIPFNNDITREGGGNNFYNNNQTANRAFDIDPNNIESIEVLKGLAASTLYGSQGSNGVILITTKTGSGKGTAGENKLTITHSNFINSIATKPDYQYEYGQGNDGIFDPVSFFSWGPRYQRDGLLGYANSPLIDENGTYEHPYSSTNIQSVKDAFPELQGTRIPYKPHDIFGGFFKPGLVTTTNGLFTSTSNNGKTSYNASFGHLNDESFMPGNTVRRTNLSIGGTTKIADKLTFNASMNYTATKLSTVRSAFDFSGLSDRGSIYPLLLAMPRSVDLMGLPYQNPNDGSSVWFWDSSDTNNNPRWLAENDRFNANTSRYNWSARLNYQLTDNLSIMWRSGNDIYFTNRFNYRNRGGTTFPARGFIEKQFVSGSIWDHTLQLSGEYGLGEKLNLSFQAGANARQNKSENTFTRKENQVSYGVLLFNNFDGRTTTGDSRDSQNQVGIFGQTTLDYSDMFFLNLAIRSDWVSNLRKGFNNATYPSASISFLPTTAFEGLRSENGLNYLKLRAGYGSSARFLSGYPTDANVTQVINARGIITNTVIGDRLIDIEPEIVSELEVGFEANFFRKRGSVDLSLWKRKTTDVFGDILVPPSTANRFTIPTNNGDIEAKGIEINLGLDIIKSTNLTWNSRVNFSAHEEILLKREDIFDAFGNNRPFFSGIAFNAAIPGESLGTIVGSKIARNEDGIPLVDNRGFYIEDTEDENDNAHVIGDAIPDYRMNFINSFTYKNWNFSFMIHHTKGGDFYSQVPALLYGRGVTTGNLHEHGNSIIIDGVKSNGEPNDIQISPRDYWHSNVVFGAAELKVYDASLIRLQEVSLSYDFPDSFIKKSPFSSLRLTAQGFNLWHKAYNIPDGINLDTNTTGPGIGNNRGIDYTNNPGSRRYGLTLKATF